MTTIDEIRPFDGHAVLVYEDGSALSSSVPATLASAGPNGGIVIVATAEHRAMLLDGLAELTDLDALERADRLVVLDARDALDRFMVNGHPDPELFAKVIGHPVLELGSRGPVVAFGEMVAVLWDAAEISAALELEDLWNGLGALVPLELVCGYSARSLASSQGADHVACRHDHQLRRAAFTSLPCDPGSVTAARQFATSTLLDWGLPDLVPDTQIVVSELAANSVVHAGTPLHLSVRERDQTVRIIVGDQSVAPPRLREPDVEAAGGRGLHLIEASGIAWGHQALDGEKRVWVDLRLPSS